MTEVHLDKEKQEAQKTVVAFIVGLLVGGLLVWVFSGSGSTPTPTDDTSSDTHTSTELDTTKGSDTTTGNASATTNDKGGSETTAPEMVVGDARVEVSDQPAGMVVSLDGATFPTDTGWIGVRTYANGQLGSVLGVALYSKDEGLVPQEITLLSPTTAGNEYAIVFYTEDGDRQFTLANDVQMDTAITNFTAR